MAIHLHQMSSNVLKWDVEDVSRWSTTLPLTTDYSNRMKELSIDGEMLLTSNCKSLIDFIGISCPMDQTTFLQAIRRLSSSKIPIQAPPTSSSPGGISSTGSFSSSISSPALSHSPLKCDSPCSFSFVTDDDQRNINRTRLKSSLKSKSLDELISNKETVLTTSSNQSHLFDVLRSENIFLKKELEYYYERVSRLQKLELELQQLQDSYRLLEGTSNRKAKLEKTMRERLEEELLRMKQSQSHLKAELHSVKRVSNNKQKDALRESTIEKLLEQNEEAIVLRQRLESNLEFTKSIVRRSSYQHKRRSEPIESDRTATPIVGDSLDNGMTIHCNNNKKHHHLQHDVAQVFLRNLEGLQSLLSAMQVSSDNRQKLEQQLRKQLEEKVKELEAGRSNSKGQLEQDQQIRIATLEADLAQVEQKYAELLAEQLTMNETRRNQLNLLEHGKIDREEELKAVRTQRDKYLKQLEEANQKIIKQEKRILALETSLNDRLVNTTNISTRPIATAISHPSLPIVSVNGHSVSHNLPVRKISSPASPYHPSTPTSGYYQLQTTPTSAYMHHPSSSTSSLCSHLTATLPSYDEHLHGMRYPSSHHHHNGGGGGHVSPTKLHASCYGETTMVNNSSHSFPNTPETVRRRIFPDNSVPTTMDNNFLCTSSPAGSLRSAMNSIAVLESSKPIHKSLTPPPMVKQKIPPFDASYTLSSQPSIDIPTRVNGGHTPSYGIPAADTGSVDSLELSPASLSPPTRYQLLGGKGPGLLLGGKGPGLLLGGRGSHNCHSSSGLSHMFHEHSNSSHK